MRTFVVSTRVDAKDSKVVNDLARLEGDDKSVILRKLMRLGLETYRREVAIRSYSQGKSTLNRSAEIMGVTVWEFLAELGRQGVTLNYDSREYLKDIQTIKNSSASKRK